MLNEDKELSGLEVNEEVESNDFNESLIEVISIEDMLISIATLRPDIHGDGSKGILPIIREVSEMLGAPMPMYTGSEEGLGQYLTRLNRLLIESCNVADGDTSLLTSNDLEE